ncbi:MAG: ribonuclease HIII [Victivallales bacterium]|nr:ribonuclease HIII [Victivallales bacterium]
MAVTNYVCEINEAQAALLRALMEERGWEFSSMQYARWKAIHDKTQVTAYESGKLVVQGKGTEDFVLYLLEPEVLHEAHLGYEQEIAAMQNPRMFLPHAGIDESGKGDFFGPLCIACVYTDEKIAKSLLKAGVADSKTIGTDRKINELAELIRRETAGRFALVVVGPEAYNRLYANIGNLNRLLAWGHAKALENLLAKVPDCPRAISDQFAKSQDTVRNALQTRGQQIELEQMPRAEADVAVAAASILARCEFVKRMQALGEAVIGRSLPKGVSDIVLSAAREIVEKQGADALYRYAKMHFKTAEQVLKG